MERSLNGRAAILLRSGVRRPIESARPHKVRTSEHYCIVGRCDGIHPENRYVSLIARGSIAPGLQEPREVRPCRKKDHPR